VVAAVRVKGRVAAAVAVVSFLAIGLHGRVAKVLEKATVPISDDGLAWIGRTRRSLAAGGADLLIWAAESLLEDATGCWLLSGSAGELGWPVGGVTESSWRGSGARRRCCTDLDKGLSPDLLLPLSAPG